MIGLFAAAWIGHTEESRAMAQDLVRAFQLAGLKHETAASLMGLTPPQLARQLAGAEPLNLFRLGFLPVAFDVAWIRLRAQRIGGALVTAEERAFVLSAAQLGVKTMAKMLPDLFADRQVG